MTTAHDPAGVDRPPPGPTPSPVAPEVSLRVAREGFAAAAARLGVVERSFSVGGRSLVLRFAGDALAEPLTAALEHHPAAGGDGPRLVVSIWDVASSGVPMPPYPEVALDGGITGGQRTRQAPPVRMQYQHAQRGLNVLDRAGDAAFVCIEEPTTLPYWEVGAPLLTLISWWMEEHGRQLVHGAAVGTESGGLLLVARGGSGKSSTALATLVAGGELRYAGDDYCLVGVDPEPVAWSLYGTAKLNADQAERFPDLVCGPVLNAGRGDEKTLISVSRGAPERFVARFPIRALVVPAIGSPAARVEPLSAGLALRALAPSTVLQLSGAGARAFGTLAGLARQVPCFTLHLPPDPRDAPTALAELLATLEH